MKTPETRRRKNNSRSKPLPPSKRLRLEAQRVLKERVQDIADKKGIKLRFCNLKDCENHIQSLDSPCASVRMEIGWPPGVPFAHPHDLPNKAKIGFLETYEPGWSATHDMELSLLETGEPSQHTPNCNCDSLPHFVFLIYTLLSLLIFPMHAFIHGNCCVPSIFCVAISYYKFLTKTETWKWGAIPAIGL